MASSLLIPETETPEMVTPSAMRRSGMVATVGGSVGSGSVGNVGTASMVGGFLGKEIRTSSAVNTSATQVQQMISTNRI